MSRPHASVVIPTKNGMPRIVRVLDKVLGQETPWNYDVIVIDSGSIDGTVEYARAQPRTRVLCIPPESFGHGRTRNEAIAATNAPYVALLTHDAEPADCTWLVNIVRAVEQSDRVAGAFGRHVAYPDADPFTIRDLEAHFASFLKYPLIVHKDLDPARYANDVGWRQFLHFFSDNNSCLRRSIWEVHPYPDVEFAEDQIWARGIIEAGHQKAYAPDAVVYHSHNYSLFERLRRSFDESRNFKAYFGYLLAKDAEAVIGSIIGLTRTDLRYALNSNRDRISLQQLTKRLVGNAMLALGHYLGSHYERVPITFQRILSRDYRLFVKR